MIEDTIVNIKIIIALFLSLVILLIIWKTGEFLKLIELFYNRRRKLEAIYEAVWEKSSSLKPNKILRGRPFYAYYYERQEDRKIKEAIEDKKNVLVIGRPLAGKTRAIYQALINLNNYDVIIPKCIDINFDSLLVPTHLNFWRNKILFLDDLNRFVEKENFEHLLNKFLDNNTIIVASCRSSIEYDKAENELLAKGLDPALIFGKCIIELPDISKEEGKNIAAKIGKPWDEIEFNRTVGSIFMPLSEMRRRFNGCHDDEKNILEVIKLLYRCGLYKENQIFPLEWINIMCDKKYELKEKKLERNRWLEKLNSKEIIRLGKDKRIWVDEIYLEKIIKQDSEISDLYLFREMIDDFSDSPDVFFDSPDVLFRFANNAYYAIGILDEKKIKLYKMARNVCETAIEKTSKNSIEYAHFQKLLGITYRVLSEIEETNRYDNGKKAIEACKKACDIYKSKKDFLMDYALSQSDLGTAYRHYAKINNEKEKKHEYCEEAIHACKKALEINEFPRRYRATTLSICGSAYRILAEVGEKKSESCNKAIKCCEEAISIYTKEALPIQVAATQNVLGGVYKLLAEIEDKNENCKKAIKYCSEALKVRTLKDSPPEQN